jgi:hypothetical protein
MNFTQISGITDYNIGCCCSYDGQKSFYFKLLSTTSIQIYYSTNYCVSWNTQTINFTATGAFYFGVRFVINNFDCSKIVLSLNSNKPDKINCIIIYFSSNQFTFNLSLCPAGVLTYGTISADGNIIAFTMNNESTLHLSLNGGQNFNTYQIPLFSSENPVAIAKESSVLYITSGIRLYKIDLTNPTISFTLVNNNIGFENDNRSYSLVCSNKVSQSDPELGIIYIAGDKGLLYKSTNDGVTFSKNNNLVIQNKTNFITASLDCNFLLLYKNNESLQQASFNNGATFTAYSNNSNYAYISGYSTTISTVIYPNLMLTSGANLYYATLPACFGKNSVVLLYNDTPIKISELKESEMIKTIHGLQKIKKLRCDIIPLKDKNIIKVLRKHKISNNYPSENLYITSSHYLFFNDINNYTNLNYNQENYKTLPHNKDYKPLLVSDCNLMEELNGDDINFLNEDGNIKLYNIEFDNNTIFIVNNINVNSL